MKDVGIRKITDELDTALKELQDRSGRTRQEMIYDAVGFLHWAMKVSDRHNKVGEVDPSTNEVIMLMDFSGPLPPITDEYGALKKIRLLTNQLRASRDSRETLRIAKELEQAVKELPHDNDKG